MGVTTRTFGIMVATILAVANDGGMDPLAAASLHGWVNLTNVSGRPCTLDTGPRPVIAAHGAVRFAMRLAIPALACPAGRVTVSWQPAYASGGPQASFTVAARG